MDGLVTGLALGILLVMALWRSAAKKAKSAAPPRKTDEERKTREREEEHERRRRSDLAKFLADPRFLR